jgi:acyl carrier protein
MDREIAYTVTVASVQEILQQGSTGPVEIGPDTVIVGPDAVVDSIGVVSLIVEIEQRLEADHGIAVTLANERAMSQRNSPFRTVSTLVEHICSTADESQ